MWLKPMVSEQVKPAATNSDGSTYLSLQNVKTNPCRWKLELVILDGNGVF